MKIDNAQVDWDEDGLPYSAKFRDVYFSRDDAEAESRHVFIAANQLEQRWHALAAGNRFVLAELGFGSGLNFMQTLQLWLATAAPGNTLHYLAFEQYPLTMADMNRLHALWPACGAASALLLPQYPDHTAGCHRLHIADNVILDLFYGDAHALLTTETTFAHCQIDCWFLDGFSPSLNPGLWEEKLLMRVGELSSPGTTLSTYSVAGTARRRLTAAGFKCEKIAGFGRKREMLFATKIALAPPTALATGVSPPLWFAVPESHTAIGHAVVIGAGLAGCSTAHSLAQRGWRVTVLDRAAAPVAGASGIPQLALRVRLFNQPSIQSRFLTQAFVYANRYFTRLQTRTDIHWHPTGVLQLPAAMNKAQPVTATTIARDYNAQVAVAVDQAQASAKAQLQVTDGGLFLPLGGWILPASLCSTYLDHSAITFYGETEVLALQQNTDGTWQIQTSDSPQPISGADVVVVANAGTATALQQCAYLPIEQIRGQASTVATTPASDKLRTVVNGARTVFPAMGSVGSNSIRAAHTLAASYSRTTLEGTVDAEEDQLNLALAKQNFAEESILGSEVLASHLAYRCNSSDRMPVVGRLPNYSESVRLLSALARNAHHQFEAQQVDCTKLYYQGLYITTAHGSNGLATCPLSAELLASLICNENLPCSGGITAALSPMRFIVRNLKKQRISVAAD